MLLKVKNNKCLSLLIAGLVVLSALVGYQLVEARFSEPNFDQIIEQADAVDNVQVRMEVVAETTATSTVLVDRSDVTNFPHLGAGATGIEVAQLKVDWSTDLAVATTTTTIKVGVLASSTDSGSNVDVYWFEEFSFTSTAGSFFGKQSKMVSYSPSVVKLALSGGQPSGFLTNDSSLYTTDYATTTKLLSPNGYINPGVGDLVMQVYSQVGTATTTITAVYRTR